MPKYNYVAMDSRGKESKGTLEVASQNEAIGRVKDMGLFPTRIVEIEKEKPDKKAKPTGKAPGKKGGINFSEALAQHPKVFNRLFVNMVKAGELGGVLEVVLARLSEFMEKAQKIKGKVIAAMFYPVAVLIVATAILLILMVKVVPSFKEVFTGMLEGAQFPAFTRLVLGISRMMKDNILMTLGILVAFI